MTILAVYVVMAAVLYLLCRSEPVDIIDEDEWRQRRRFK